MLFFQLMLMGKTTNNQSLSKPLLLLLGVLFPSLCFVCFQGFGLSAFLFSFPIMILSTLFLFKFTKKKPASNDINQLSSQNNFHEDKVREQFHQEVETQKHETKNEALDPISECFEEIEAAQISKNGTESEGLELEEDFPSSESEVSLSDTSEDFEPKWNVSSTNMGQNLAIHDCSFSEYEYDDDENLIEISLPGSESRSFKEDEPMPNLPDFLPESIFSGQKGFMELLADMNEEENLIEIDLSVGSIKCPRFEIKA